MRHDGLHRRGIIFSVFLIVFYYIVPVFPDFPEYETNPFSFEIAEFPYGDSYWWPAWGEDFLTADVNDDGLLDFVFRSETKLYVYDHNGTLMWSPITIQSPPSNGGAKFGAADVDGDGQTEIVAINANDGVYPIYIYDGSSGAFERNLGMPGLQPYQKVGHLVIANLQGNGNRYAIIQTVDETEENSSIYYYLNRSLIAIDLKTGIELWHQYQDRSHPPYYQGYWGQAHGPLLVADVDFDGRDEVAGGNLIEDEGTAIDLGYPMSWIGKQDDATNHFIDHLDAIAVGDFRPDKRGLEWVVTEEDWAGTTNEWNTTLMYYNLSNPTCSIVWRKETSLFTDGPDREPQNINVGNFDLDYQYAEIWVRSRFGNSFTSQHPWIYDTNGDLLNDYTTESVLPGSSPADYFNQSSLGGYNKQGLEMIWTIDWDGSAMEFIAAKARHDIGNIGVFNAMTGASIWHTGTDPEADFGSVQAHLIYVADVAGDPREEVIVCDESVSPPQIRVYWNEANNPNPPKECKWDDPLYRRLKQNWNYYSPGSYTQPAPAILQLCVLLEGPYVASSHTMQTALLGDGVIPLQSPYTEDPIGVDAIPDDVTDWILLELRQTPSGSSVLSRSLFLKNDGTVLDLDGSDTGVSLSAFRGLYYLVVKHRNHLGVMSAEPVRLAADSTSMYDFTSGLTQYYGERAKLLETGVYGLYTGDANADGQVKVDDKNDYWWIQVGRAGYWSGDFSLDGQVKVDDKNDFWWQNVGIGSQVPVP